MKNTIGYISFSLVSLLILVMGWATWEEHLHGTDFVFRYIYQSFWFNLLWAWLVVVGGYYLLETRLYRRLPVFLIHLALVIILIGAMITRFSGKTGMVHLRSNQEVTAFFCEEAHRNLPLPFSLQLNEFRVEYYPGTSSPSNYVSIVSIKDQEKNSTFEKEISMNQILNYRGYRFYQSSFDEDMKGSVLSVNRDVVGIFITYTGYYLLFVSMCWVLFDKRGRFITLLKKNNLRET